MKHLVIIIVYLSVCNHYAQNRDVELFDLKNRAVLSPAGSSHQDDQLAIRWTLGNTLLKRSEETQENSANAHEYYYTLNVYSNPTNGKLVVSHKNYEEQEETNFGLVSC